MTTDKFLFKPDEDNDFIPIIPINEDGEEKNLVIPDIMPLLPLRNTVLFPGVVIPITVGRDKSIKAVNDAYKTDKLIGVLAQKDPNLEDPVFNDLCDIGTIAKIVKLIKMPDGGTTIIIQGKKRFRVIDLVSDDPYFKARVDVIVDDELPDGQDFEATISSIKDLAAQIISLSIS
jgi:ATP-dependent Lon protease